MKKLLSLVLAVVLIMSLAVPAFAAQADDVASVTGCTHSGTPKTEEQLTYIYKDNTCHNKYRTYVYYCRSCGVFLGNSNATLIDTPAHTHDAGAGTYVSSTHVGDYSVHYYTYKGPCNICDHSYTWPVDAPCQKSNCVDPY